MGLILRRLEAVLPLHVLHDIPQLPALADIESLNLEVHRRPLVVCRHELWCW